MFERDRLHDPMPVESLRAIRLRSRHINPGARMKVFGSHQGHRQQRNGRLSPASVPAVRGDGKFNEQLVQAAS
jgi:hypothetical protein